MAMTVALGALAAALLIASCGSRSPAEPRTEPSAAASVPAVAPAEAATPPAETVTIATTPVAPASTPLAEATRAAPASPPPAGEPAPTSTRANPVTSPGCDAGSPLTHLYTDLDQIAHVQPTIVTSGNWLKNRQYHAVVTDAAGNAPEVPIYAPADAMATGITHYLGLMHPWQGAPFELAQLEIRFQAACGLTFGFDHVSRFVEPFASLVPEPVRDTRDAEVPIHVEVKAGDLIGYSSGTVPAHTWDFVLSDHSRTLRFANQRRYEESGDLRVLLHAACPLDYLAPELRAEWASALGSWQGVDAAARCRLDADAPGALAGGWFQTPFDPDASWHPADWGVVALVAADGYLDVNGPGRAVRTAPTHPSFADPAQVTGEHCFEDYKAPTSYAYVRVQPDGTLAAAFGDGPCPASLPAAHAVYYR